MVFTLPQELRRLARANPKEMYELVLEAAARTLLDFGRSRLRAQLGVTTVLHTWTRELRFHPHAHCIVTAGGLADDGHWVPARSRFLFPVRAMSQVVDGHPDPRGFDLRVVTESGTAAKLAAAMGPA